MAMSSNKSVMLRKLDGSLRTQLELPRQPSEGCLLLRKLHGRLRSQLELPRQPSEGCSIGALEPAGSDELMRVVFGSHTLQIRTPLASGAGTWAQLSPSSNLEHNIWNGLGFISDPFRKRFRDTIWS